jgi:hypothetical protein
VQPDLVFGEPQVGGHRHRKAGLELGLKVGPDGPGLTSKTQRKVSENSKFTGLLALLLFLAFGAYLLSL